MAVKLVITRREVVELQCCAANQDGMVVELRCCAFGGKEKKKLLDTFGKGKDEFLFLFFGY